MKLVTSFLTVEALCSFSKNSVLSILLKSYPFMSLFQDVIVSHEMQLEAQCNLSQWSRSSLADYFTSACAYLAQRLRGAASSY
jgi:hypothetical protein